MGLEKELGTVERGKRADLVVLDFDPLERISNIRSVRFVVTDGRMYESAALWRNVRFAP
jgi:imidazolonepropionase-like amidohydrolase